jgi:hypothetical protein
MAPVTYVVAATMGTNLDTVYSSMPVILSELI